MTITSPPEDATTSSSFLPSSLSSLLLITSPYLQVGAFILATHDKAVSKGFVPFVRWRVSERTFLLASFLGALPSLILAFFLLSHKTSVRKSSFRMQVFASAVTGAAARQYVGQVETLAIVAGAVLVDRVARFVLAGLKWQLFPLCVVVAVCAVVVKLRLLD